MSTFFAVIGRIFIAVIFIVSGAIKLMSVDITNAQIVSVGLPYGLAIPTGLFELAAGLFLVLGIFTRLTAILLAIFTALATLFFHNQFTDPVQGAMAMKNLAIVGGLFLVFAHSQMWWSYDAMRRARRDEGVATKATKDSESRVRDAEGRAHEAELRVARMEGAISASDAPVVTDVPTTKSGWS